MTSKRLLLLKRHSENGKISGLQILGVDANYWIAFRELFVVHVPLSVHALGENVLQLRSDQSRPAYAYA